MKKTILGSTLAALVVTGAATVAFGADTMKTDTSKSTLKSGDKSFVEKAVQSGNAEVIAAKLAQQKSSNPAVKSFAEMMSKDHSNAAAKLSSIATQKGVTVSEDDTGKYKSDLEKLSKLDGADFDKAFATKVGVSAHKDAVSLFEKESKSGADGDLKTFAGATLPTLQHHLEMAQALEKKVKG